jgi:hypothetical protein
MADPLALTFQEVWNSYIPDLYKFVVPIAHKDEHGKECLGSGVFVNLSGRHFIATAAHVIKDDPRILNDHFYLQNGCLDSDKPTRMLQKRAHPVLDIGFLEIADQPRAEMTQGQLHLEIPLPGSTMFVIGHPVCRIERDAKRREFIVNRSAFGTNAIDLQNDYWKLAYPVEGVCVENGAWKYGEKFPETPHGFSGGGCFGISKTERAGLEVIEYKLLGIQYSWDDVGRWVKVVPIEHWLDGALKALQSPSQQRNMAFTVSSPTAQP